MKYTLAYGKGKLEFQMPDGVTPLTVVPGKRESLADPQGETEAMLKNPVGTPPLVEMLKSGKPEKVVVVLNDITRPTPYGVLLPPLLKSFAEAGIRDEQVTFLIALGIHDPHTERQNREVYGDELVDRFTILNHEGENPDMLVNLGPLESGYDFVVNKLVYEADFLITLGVVMPHYFAGYSGGRKSILPGMVSKATVAANHARLVEIMDDMPHIDRNPISREMIAAARKVGVNFIINAVTNDAQELVSVVAGDLERAWRKAVDVSASMFEVPFEKQADVCVTCASGYPRDINVYQAQKGLDHADHITRPGGTIVIAAECAAGWGEDVFEEWVKRKWPAAKVMEEIKRSFVLGGHKAYGYAKVAVDKEVILISALSEEDTALLWAKKAGSVQEAVDAARKKHGPGASWVYMPEGSLSLPVHKH